MFKKSIAGVFGGLITLLSIYFGQGFFEWFGLNQFFSWVAAVIIGCMLNFVFQLMIDQFRKKHFTATILAVVWIMFLSLDVFSSYVGMWYKIDNAKQARIVKAKILVQSDQALIMQDSLIASKLAIVNSLQKDYAVENNSWWKSKIRADLIAANSEYDAAIKTRQSMTSAAGEEAAQSEIFTDMTGQINPMLKVFLSVALGLLIDLSSCIIFIYTWIFTKKSDIVKVDHSGNGGKIIEIKKPDYELKEDKKPEKKACFKEQDDFLPGDLCFD